tara:strand:- start:451 stop:696 length:246 start_codon:yes stop_codon:yes gene_type:complete
MMYRVVQAKEIPGREKPLWLRLGTAFEKEGRISGIKLDVLPLPDQKGEVWLRLFKEDESKSENKPESSGQFGGGNQAPWGG